MMRHGKYLLGATASLLICVLASCGGAGDDRPARVAVQGEISLNGQPLAGATVVFMPVVDGHPAAYGTTDDAGRYSLTTFATHDGAVPGDYAITVIKQRAEGTMTTEQASAYFGRTGQPPPPPKFVDLLPERYADRTTSGLTASVISDEANFFIFELTDQ